LRRLLFSKWFFGLLLFVLVLDLSSDVAEHLTAHTRLLNYMSIFFDSVGLFLVLWMFVDLSRRRPTDGDNPRRG
jgi:hypothetical protein